MSIIKKIKNINDDKFQWLVLSIFFLQPIFELDHLAYEFLNQFSIPLPSTIFHLIFIPLVIVLVFIKMDEKKKSTVIMCISYLLILGIYFVFHCINAISIYESLYLTNNFYFNVFQEFTYIYTLVIPYFIIYAFFKTNIKFDNIKKVILTVSLITSLLIIAGDLFLFGQSTYSYDITKATIFTWFNGIYDVYHPRELASKFFFPEGNTLGIFQFMILPILYYFMANSKITKERILVGIIIFLQSIAMIILSTKVATYGTLIIPIASLIVYILFLILKHYKINVIYIVVSIIMIVLVSFIIPNSPAYVNTQIETENDVAVLNDNYLLEQAKGELDSEGLVPGTAEYNYYYIHYFEDWGIKSRLISSVPVEYYTLYYNYIFDAKFWWDVLDLYPLEQRANGRQVQTIFNNYKWNNTDDKTKLLGMGYSTFMNGSFLIEQDFIQQRYTLGYVGAIITMAPWIILLLVGVMKLLTNFKRNFNFKVIMFAMAYCIGIGSSIMSGHTLDEYLTTITLALIASILLTNLFNGNHDE